MAYNLSANELIPKLYTFIKFVLSLKFSNNNLKAILERSIKLKIMNNLIFLSMYVKTFIKKNPL